MPSDCPFLNATRINVVGVSGCGKSTFARQLADQLDLAYLQLDALYWGPNWSEPDDETFFAKIETAIESARGRWVIDGNYSRSVSTKWRHVQTVVWLDFPFAVVFKRALLRAIRRIATREELWPNTGNRETFAKTFLSRESVLLWTVTSFATVRRRYRALLSDPQFSHIEFVCLRSPLAARSYLAGRTES